MNQIERITINEKRLDNVLNNIKELDNNLKTFKNNKKNIELLNKYYGSKNWFKDKEDFESNKISNIKAGVLSEDAIWNMSDDIKDILLDMEEIIKLYRG